MGVLQKELQDSKQALEAAQSEVECLREMVAGWEEAFAKAQQELETLKVRCLNLCISEISEQRSPNRASMGNPTPQ